MSELVNDLRQFDAGVDRFLESLPPETHFLPQLKHVRETIPLMLPGNTREFEDVLLRGLGACEERRCATEVSEDGSVDSAYRRVTPGRIAWLVSSTIGYALENNYDWDNERCDAFRRCFSWRDFVTLGRITREARYMYRLLYTLSQTVRDVGTQTITQADNAQIDAMSFREFFGMWERAGHPDATSQYVSDLCRNSHNEGTDRMCDSCEATWRRMTREQKHNALRTVGWQPVAHPELRALVEALDSIAHAKGND